ncbi:hypothetical protein K443DRAFT_678155 [Laccaria amethystina LaAM-08-1]|uniref:Uncharacterized protein n=1 Tax=Laccaria amethystina LaAM-08-1 TaxID=1095629 RepID=A0A0C9Y0Y2_9AGAR|nr:hypothetical protein K443DRAFT_678155 [Laccaria amethystina LaAM-08-1]
MGRSGTLSIHLSTPWSLQRTLLPAPLQRSVPQPTAPALAVVEEKPVENTLENLAKGIINTSKNKDKFTIMLVDGIGTGKTSVLSLLVNVMAGRQPGEHDLEPYDVTNEHGGS